MKSTNAIRYTVMAIAVLVMGGGTCNPDAFSLYVLENYGSVQLQEVDVDGDSFAVADKPEEGRVLVAHIEKFLPIDQWRHVAEVFLKRSGRACTISRGNADTVASHARRVVALQRLPISILLCSNDAA